MQTHTAQNKNHIGAPPYTPPLVKKFNGRTPNTTKNSTTFAPSFNLSSLIKMIAANAKNMNANELTIFSCAVTSDTSSNTIITAIILRHEKTT